MSGYRRQSKVLVLKLEDEPGLEIRVRPISIGKALKAMELAGLADKEDVTAEDLAGVGELFAMFIERVISWNLEHEKADGQWAPTPRTVDGLDLHDSDFVMAVVMAWLKASMGAPSAPLDETSPAGKPWEELSLPMEPLSASRPS